MNEDKQPRWHEHSFTIKPTGEYAMGAQCPCGHIVVPDEIVPDGEAVRVKQNVTRVGLGTIEDLNTLRTAFQTEAYFPPCPVKAIRERAEKRA